MTMAYIFLIGLCMAAVPALGQLMTLEQYNIDPASVTVSGISSGAGMSTQFHVVHSSEVLGAAMFAGVPFHCAKGNFAEASICMLSPWLYSVGDLIDKTIQYADSGKIDPIQGMAFDRVFIWQGTKDLVVDSGNGPKLVTYYEYFNADIGTQLNLAAEHCQPTDNYGPACDHLGGEFINNCDYNGAYEALNWMYGNVLIKVDGADVNYPLNGIFSEFSQIEFFPQNDAHKFGMDTTGYIYIPSGCMDKTQACRFHIAFHGCKAGREFMGDTYEKKTEYLQAAEANNIIMLFPQVISSLLQGNPQGCWDWWGYTGIFDYDTNSGPQIQGVYQMMQRLIYGL